MVFECCQCRGLVTHVDAEDVAGDGLSGGKDGV